MPFSATDLLERFNAAFNRHDVEGMLALMTADCLFENTYPAPDGTRCHGRLSQSKFWQEFFAASPLARLEIEEVFTCGERAFQRWVYHWGEAEGVTGHVRGVDIFRIRQGKIAEKLSYVKG